MLIVEENVRWLLEAFVSELFNCLNCVLHYIVLQLTEMSIKLLNNVKTDILFCFTVYVCIQ